MKEHANEVIAGQRFEFGKNWALFLESLDDGQLARAEQSLQGMLGVVGFAGKSFLDAGSGSGIFSLSARRLGARVHSFDYDPQSVACARELKRRYSPEDPNWSIDEGSVLDANYLSSLGRFDIVYSWGVLHHTGAMWQAIGNIAALVADNGTLFISIYNDQGKFSRRWRAVKRAYNRLPRGLRFLVTIPVFVYLWGPRLVKDLFRLRPLQSWQGYGRERGMSLWRDVMDWVGGYPFEVAKPEEVFDFCRERGFCLVKLKTSGGSLGCNEFVFQKATVVPSRVY